MSDIAAHAETITITMTVTVAVDQGGYDRNYGDGGNAVEYATELLHERLPQGFGAFDWFHFVCVEAAKS